MKTLLICVLFLVDPLAFARDRRERAADKTFRQEPSEQIQYEDHVSNPSRGVGTRAPRLMRRRVPADQAERSRDTVKKDTEPDHLEPDRD